MLIVGDREVDNATVSLRLRNGEQQNDRPLENFKEIIVTAINDKSREL